MELTEQFNMITIACDRLVQLDVIVSLCMVKQVTQNTIV